MQIEKITYRPKKRLFLFFLKIYHNRLSLLKLSQIKSELSFTTIQNSIWQCERGAYKFHLILQICFRRMENNR